MQPGTMQSAAPSVAGSGGWKMEMAGTVIGAAMDSENPQIRSKCGMTEDWKISDEEAAANDEWFDLMMGEDYLYVTKPRAAPDPCVCCGGQLVHNPICHELLADWDTMDFGKYKGKKYTDVPTGYLEFLIRRGFKRPKERQAWLKELQSRDPAYRTLKWENMAEKETGYQDGNMVSSSPKFRGDRDK